MRAVRRFPPVAGGRRVLHGVVTRRPWSLELATGRGVVIARFAPVRSAKKDGKKANGGSRIRSAVALLPFAVSTS